MNEVTTPQRRATVRRALTAATALALATTSLTAWGVASATAASTSVNDNASSIAYSAGWSYSTANAGYLNLDAHYSATAGATALFSFSDTAVRWIGGHNADHGKADVAICDASGANCGSATTVDTYATSAQPQQTLFAASGLTNAAHTLKITVRADSSGAGHYTDIDAFATGVAAVMTATYYVDNASGSGCSDAGAGTTTTTPFCTFAPLNGQTFGVGAQVLLKRGDTFTGELGKLFGSGSSATPIVVGAYGTGARPHITGSGQAADRAVWIEDGSYWAVRDLEVSNAGAGIVFWYNSNGHHGITVDDVYTHDVNGVFAGAPKQTDLPGMYHSAGVLVTGNVPVTASESAVSDLTFSNLEGYNDNDDIDISGFNANSGGQQGFLSTVLGHHSVSNVRLLDSYFHTALSGENFDNLQNMTITGIRMDDTGHGANTSGTTALFFWSSSTVTVSNSMFANEVSTSSPDQTETDLEALNDHIRFLGNYYAGSAGGAIEILELNGVPDNYQSNHEIGDNLFASYGGGSAFYGGLTNPPSNVSGVAHDNLYPATSGLTSGLPEWIHTTGTTGYYGSDAHYIGASSASATLSFTGTSVSWIGGKNTDHGKADVSVCDAAGANCGPSTTVDTYAAAAQSQQTLFSSTGLTNAAHTLRITVRADSSGTGHFTDIDAFLVGATEINDTDPAIAYVGTWTFANNAPVAPSTMFNAGSGFSSTMGTWRYQYRSGSGAWLDINPFDAANQRWGSNGYVARFVTMPDTCATCSIARDWVAPSSGSISIRGRVLKDALGGDGVTARITRNGTQVWPSTTGAQTIAAMDASGYDTNVDLTVAAGDSIRFELTDGGAGNATADATAWAPSIAYR